MDFHSKNELLKPWSMKLNYLTNAMKQSPSWETDSSWAIQEIAHILWNPGVPVLSQISLIRAPHPTSWWSFLILSSHIHIIGLPSDLFPSGFATKTLYAPVLSPYMTHDPPFIPLDMIARVLGADH